MAIKVGEAGRSLVVQDSHCIKSKYSSASRKHNTSRVRKDECRNISSEMYFWGLERVTRLTRLVF